MKNQVIHLTVQQLNILMLLLAYPDSYCNFELVHYRIIGHIDLSAIIKTWNQIFMIHPELSSVFQWENCSQPIQIITYEKPEIVIEKAETYNEYEKLIEQNKRLRVDIRKKSYRIILIEYKNNIEMLIATHHILYDGWSSGIIINNFLTIYNKILSGSDNNIIKNTFGYSSFSRVSKNESQIAIDYLQKYLSDYKHYTDKIYNANILFDTKSYYRTYLDDINYSDLYVLSGNMQVTAASIIFGLWGHIRLNNMNIDDIVIGSVFSGRNPYISGIENRIGPFINTLPIRMKKNVLNNMIKNVHKDIIALYDYQHIPLDMEAYRKLPFFSYENTIVFQNYMINNQLLKKNKSNIYIEYIEAFYYPNNPLSFEIKILGKQLIFEFCYDNSYYSCNEIRNYSYDIVELLAKLIKEEA